MANYLIYPMKVMKISQGYSGNYSHAPHSAGTPKDTLGMKLGQIAEENIAIVLATR